MSKNKVITPDFEELKIKLENLKGKEITITVKDRTKIKVKKGVITIVSDNLFCLDVKIGKYHTCNYSHTFIDIKTGKVVIEELEI